MKKKMLIWAVPAALLFLGACSTVDMFTFEDENIYAELEMNDPGRVTLTVDNRGSGELTVDQERASYTGGGRRTPLRAVSEDSAPPLPLQISPGAQQTRSFAPAEALALSDGKLKTADWVPEDNSDDRFDFMYNIDGGEHTFTFPDSRERPLLGKVQVSLDIALPFRYSIAERRRMIYDLAVDQANKAFGERGKKLRLVNIHYDSVSKGFSEKIQLTAEVIAPESGN
jgi:hypothetical protein